MGARDNRDSSMQEFHDKLFEALETQRALLMRLEAKQHAEPEKKTNGTSLIYKIIAGVVPFLIGIIFSLVIYINAKNDERFKDIESKIDKIWFALVAKNVIDPGK